MNRLLYLSMRMIIPTGCALAAIGLSTASAEIQPGEVRIESIQGAVTYSTDQSTWLEVKPGLVLQKGATIKTGPGASADLVLEYSGTVLRMTSDSALGLGRLDQEVAGENVISETSLNLKSGSVLGSQRKLAKPSTFEITTPRSVASIRGTEYAVRADGAVSCFRGEVSVRYDSPQHSGSTQANVRAGYSFNPATGRVAATTPESFGHFAGDIGAVRVHALACSGRGGGHPEEPRCPVSPTHGHGHGHDHDHGHGHDHDNGNGHDHDNGNGGHGGDDHGYGDDHQDHGR